MNRQRRRTSGPLAALLTITSLSSFAYQSDVPAAHAALSGAWVINKELSDEPASADAAGGRAAGGVTGARSRDRPNPIDVKKMQAVLKVALAVPDRLVITIAPDEAAFTFSDGRSQRVKTTGEIERHQQNEGTVQTKTMWQNGSLVKESLLAAGTNVTETYSVLSDPRRLQVVVKAENWRMPQPITTRRVYDDATAR